MSPPPEPMSPASTSPADHYIGGERVSERERFATISPIDESLLAEVAARRARDRRRRPSTPPRGFPDWAALGAVRPGAGLLRRLAELIDANVERLAAVECADMAMLLRSLRARVIRRGAATSATTPTSRSHEERDWHSNGTWNRVQRMPAGPVAVITPWNAPFMLSTWKIAPALAAGCTVVLKPAEWSPLSCSLLADARRRGRLPAGRVQRRPGDRRGGRRRARRRPALRARLVHGLDGDRAPDRRFAAANLVPFTGRARRQGPADRVRRRRPRPRRGEAAGQYDDAGQVCLAGPGCSSRSPSREPFLERFHARADAHVLGDPARRRDDDLTDDPPRPPRACGRLRRRAPRRRAPGRARRPPRRRPAVLRADADRAAVERCRDRPGRGVRAGADVSRRSPTRRRRSRSRTRPLWPFGDRLHASRAAPSASAGRCAPARLGQHVPGPRSDGAVRRNRHSGIGREGGDYALDFYSDLKTLQILEGSTR